MNIAPFLEAPIAIQMHTLGALLALALTPFIVLRRKGDRSHRNTGRIWVLAMAFTALSSFLITDIRLIGPYSPIHILSLITLVSLFQAVRFVRKGRITAHKKAVGGAALGLVGAGLFTLFPGRLMSQIVFGPDGIAGFAIALSLSVAAVLIWWLSGRASVG